MAESDRFNPAAGPGKATLPEVNDLRADYSAGNMLRRIYFTHVRSEVGTLGGRERLRQDHAVVRAEAVRER